MSSGPRPIPPYRTLPKISKPTGLICSGRTAKCWAISAWHFDGEPAYDAITGGSWLCDEPYAVLRRLALNARGRGRGLTRVLFDLAAERSRERGITYLLLNTGLQNSRMQHILEKNGFTRRGNHRLQEQPEVCLRQAHLSRAANRRPVPDRCWLHASAQKKTGQQPSGTAVLFFCFLSRSPLTGSTAPDRAGGSSPPGGDRLPCSRASRGPLPGGTAAA